MIDKNLIESLKDISIPDEKLKQIFLEKLYILSKDKEKFSKVISEECAHDFKNLISSLKLAAEGLPLLESETEKTKLKNFLYQSIIQLIENIENLFIECEFIKSSKNYTEKVNISKIIHSVIDELYPLTLGKSLEIKTDLTEVTVEINPLAIKRVLLNLLINAIKYNKQNGKIEISLKEDDSKIMIVIKDTGLGISSEIKQKLFREKIREYIDIPGSGMGILITKNIIDRLGGQIYFDSQKDNGTTFYIELPKKI